MRVQILGTSEPAKALRGHLNACSDVAVVGYMPDYTVAIQRGAEAHVTVDGVEGSLEHGIVNQLADICGTVIVRRSEGRKLPADTIRVGIPAGMEADAERALFRALSGAKRRKAWWLFLLALLLPATAQAQSITPIKCHNGTTAFFCGDSVNSALRVNVVATVGGGGGSVTQGAGFGAATGYWNTRLTDGTSFYVALTDTQLRASPVPVSGTVTATPTGTQDVNCISGCTPGGSFADAAAFTFGTSAIGLTGFVVDDVATNTVSENSAGAARMTGSRILYVDLSKTTANTTAVKVDGSAVTQPVSGTFWQATQPVSGTVTVTDGAGALNVIVDSSALPSGASTLAEQQTQTASLSVLDDWDETDRAKVNPIVGQAGVQGASGTVTALTQRVVLATDVALPAGTNAIGKLAANSGVDIGDVDVLTLPNVTIGTFPDNEPFNLAQVNGQAVNVGAGAAGTGTQRVTTSTDSTIGTVTSVTQNADVRQATAANLNTRQDTGGATGSAVPARADYLGLNDGTNLVGQKAHSAATDATAILTGAQIANPLSTWCINHTPAAATKATISQAAGAAGVRHVAGTYQACFAAGATAGPVQTWTIRDGATGAGTVLWSGAMAVPVNGGQCASGALYKVGTAATAMTIEFGAAGAATTIETVSLCGFDVQ